MAAVAMSYASEHPQYCEERASGCTASVPGGKWDQVKASKSGWFFGRDGKAYCPDHIPDWVPGWRERRFKGKYRKHVAGPVLQWAQLCARCGEVLCVAGDRDREREDASGRPFPGQWSQGRPVLSNGKRAISVQTSLASERRGAIECLPYLPQMGDRPGRARKEDPECSSSPSQGLSS